MESFKKNKNDGFTLIEIIVVLIIVGVLAAIALPNLFSNVTKSKGSTAVAAMDGVKTAIEGCTAQYNVTAGAAPCTLSNYGLTSSNGFTFTFSSSTSPQSATQGTVIAAGGAPSGGDLTYSIEATDSSGNIITLNRAMNGTFTCSAPTAGPYQGIC